MGCIKMFKSLNLYTIIIVAKIKKNFLQKKEMVKGFFIFFIFDFSSFFICMLWFKQVESNYGKKEPLERVLIELLSFLIVWILDTINMVLFFQFGLKMAVHGVLTKKICEVINFWYYFKKR